MTRTFTTTLIPALACLVSALILTSCTSLQESHVIDDNAAARKSAFELSRQFEIHGVPVKPAHDRV
ncbi:MAG: hypothetical protein VXZ24_14180, partial [Pseudomonadota bacterium]|nr:hypothetical protein [Pseudomonadota bacterium]